MGDRPIALVTGGAKRVGAATARELARAGCEVHITYRTSAQEAESLIEDIDGGGAHRLELETTSEVHRFANELGDKLGGRLDVLVHNASVYDPTPIEGFDIELAQRQFLVNAVAPLVLTAGLAPTLRNTMQQHGAGVVVMSDIHAIGRPRQGFSAYSMSKAAVTEMVRSLARDLAPSIRVNAVAPGVVKWPDEGYESDEHSQQAYLSRVPLERPGTPEDAA
ncbi:MAG: SDR family oxidoreductase, partial [Planctomycetota bacterium]